MNRTRAFRGRKPAASTSPCSAGRWSSTRPAAAMRARSCWCTESARKPPAISRDLSAEIARGFLADSVHQQDLARIAAAGLVDDHLPAEHGLVDAAGFRPRNARVLRDGDVRHRMEQ